MEKLIEEIRKYKSLVEKIDPILFFVKDVKGRYIYGNTAFIKFAGLGMPVLFERTEDVFKGFSRQMAMMQEEDVKLIAKKKDVSIKQADLKGPHGEPVSLLIIKIPVIIDNDVIGIINFGADVTLYRDGLYILFKDYLSKLSKQEKVYFYALTREMDPKSTSKLMHIFEEHSRKLKSGVLSKLGLKYQSREYFTITKLYKKLTHSNYNDH